jgi:putative selenium metabolism hydrolase
MLEAATLKRIESLVRAERDNLIAFLRDIIAIPSPSTQEEGVVQRIYEEMQTIGFDEVFIDDFGSIIGRVGEKGKRIVFDSHIDTVGVEDPAQWNFDPFIGKIKSGYVWGRGASDNKAGVAVQVYAVKILRSLFSGDLPFTLYVVGSVQEEDCDGLALGFALSRSIPRADAVVLGECTNCCIYRGHRGRMEITVRTRGSSAHASSPGRGRNAVYAMTPILKDIEKLDRRLRRDAFFGKGTIAVTRIESLSESLNSVPYECRIAIDRRLTRGEDRELALRQISSLPSVRRRATVEVLRYASPSWRGTLVEREKYFPTWALDTRHPLLKAASAAYRALFGKPARIGKWTFSTNGVASMGELGIPTIGFGPAEERFSHSMEDRVSIKHLEIATAFYAALPFFFSQTEDQ